MAIPENTQRAPVTASGDKPSLIAGSPAAGAAIAGTAPMRMLDSLDAAKVAQAKRSPLPRSPWLPLLALAIVLAVAFWWRSQVQEASPVATETTATAIRMPAVDVPAISTPVASPAASASVAVEESAGAARIERSNDGNPLSPRPFARAEAPPLVGTAASSASATRTPSVFSARPAGLPPPSNATTIAAANARTRPPGIRAAEIARNADTAPTQTTSDPDVTLLSAMLARLSGDAEVSAGTQRPTIAQLVERCEARATKDSIEAFECKRRICAGYWGKADACPMSLAPKKN